MKHYFVACLGLMALNCAKPEAETIIEYRDREVIIEVLVEDQTRINELQQQISQLQGNNSDLQSQLTELQTQLDNSYAQEDVDALESMILDLEERVSLLTGELNQPCEIELHGFYIYTPSHYNNGNVKVAVGYRALIERPNVRIKIEFQHNGVWNEYTEFRISTTQSTEYEEGTASIIETGGSFNYIERYGTTTRLWRAYLVQDDCGYQEIEIEYTP